MHRQLSKLRVRTAPGPRRARNSAGMLSRPLSSRVRSNCPRSITLPLPLAPTAGCYRRCVCILLVGDGLHTSPLLPTSSHLGSAYIHTRRNARSNFFMSSSKTWGCGGAARDGDDPTFIVHRNVLWADLSSSARATRSHFAPLAET